ncbi:hypothetical protein MMC25_005289 [Agyrium rufum]|nr:hypothetical protein [Agyrium rufum]
MASNSVHYRLSRGYTASARLNIQHFLQVKDSGYILHPSIPINRENLRIADIGTGTGIWLLDLLDSVPKSTRLDGFDVQGSQFPAKEWLPPNVHLSQLNAFDELPVDLHGKYDIVNVRYFCCVVQQNDPSAILKNLVKMLKPGGYLQWSEQDYANQSVIAANPDVKLEYFQAAKDYMESRSKLGKEAFDWISKLENSFTEHGLIDVLLARQDERPQHRDYWQDTYLMVLEEISYSMPDGGTELRKLIGASQQFSPEGVTWLRGHLTYVGRKSLNGTAEIE